MGSSIDTPTISAAVCGLAYPHADLGIEDALRDLDDPGIGPAALTLIIVTSLAVALFLLTSFLYLMGMPIPICGDFIYGHELSHKPSWQAPLPELVISEQACFKLAAAPQKGVTRNFLLQYS